MIKVFNVFIIIPVHNRKEFTRNCLSSFRKQTYQNFKIVIIDDGSTDGTEEMLKNEFPEIHIIKGDGNLWWTAAINLGVKYALENRADYILTLNNDTLAVEDFLEKMIYWAVKTPNALLGAFALDTETKKPVYGGEIINWKWANSKFLLDILPKDQWQGLHEVTHFPGRGLLIPASVFKKIGLFDSLKFPHYGADDDFTFRASKHGYKIYCNYNAILFINPDNNTRTKGLEEFSFKDFYTYLFTIKGRGNIFNYSKLVILHAPRKYVLNALLLGNTKRIMGYLFSWIKTKYKKIRYRKK